MNIVLFEPDEIHVPLPRKDPRALHILDVLRKQVGESIDVGLVNGPRGKARLADVGEEGLTLTFEWGNEPPATRPIDLLIGMPRPQTARKILQEATAMGVRSIHFVLTERSEPSYASSTLWSSGEWKRHLWEGAAQAFCTRIPLSSHGQGLAAIAASFEDKATKIALDNYEASVDLAHAIPVGERPIVLAIGSERGWSGSERLALKSLHFTLAHLGPRVLRSETACVAALAIVRATKGWL